VARRRLRLVKTALTRPGAVLARTAGADLSLSDLNVPSSLLRSVAVKTVRFLYVADAVPKQAMSILMLDRPLQASRQLLEEEFPLESVALDEIETQSVEQVF
jgi:hypothetical protein